MAYSTQDVLEALRAARSKDPQLAPTIDLHCALLEAQAGASVPHLPSLPAAEAASAGLADGRPLIELTTLPLDGPAVSELASEICEITARHRPELVDDMAAIRRYLAGDGPEGAEAIAAELLTFVFNHARRPLLSAWAQQMAKMVDISDWWQPVCPFCGGAPDLGTFDADTGGRHLLCSCCDTEWNFSRVGCPFCHDSRHAAYFPGENERYRLYVCDACQRYLKVVDMRQGWQEVMLPVERVLTVEMDLAARQAGYS